MNGDWSDKENELIVADYFSMLTDELRHVVINKSQHRKILMPFLNNRSDGSIEFKHQNISAVLIEMGLPFIKGYKPRYNFQRAKLIAAVEKFIFANKSVESDFLQFSDDVPAIFSPVEFSLWVVEPPVVDELKVNIKHARRPLKINYLEREQENRILGLKGEELVIQYERMRLLSVGKASLADSVEWVSRDLGDGLGFDILSKNINGTDKYVEVKTTKLSKESPFYFSSNEFNFSIENERNYHLYRVFDFNKTPKMFSLNGRIDNFCRIEPTQYIGRF